MLPALLFVVSDWKIEGFVPLSSATLLVTRYCDTRGGRNPPFDDKQTEGWAVQLNAHGHNSVRLIDFKERSKAAAFVYFLVDKAYEAAHVDRAAYVVTDSAVAQFLALYDKSQETEGGAE